MHANKLKIDAYVYIIGVCPKTFGILKKIPLIAEVLPVYAVETYGNYVVKEE